MRLHGAGWGGKSRTRRQILVYTALTVIAGFAPVLLGFAGQPYLAANTAVGGWFLVQAIRVATEPDHEREPQARRLFGVSILYLFVIFAAILLEQAAGIAPFPALIAG